MLKKNSLNKYSEESAEFFISHIGNKYFVTVDTRYSKTKHVGIMFIIIFIINIEKDLTRILKASDWYVLSYFWLHVLSHYGNKATNFFQKYWMANKFYCYDD